MTNKNGHRQITQIGVIAKHHSHTLSLIPAHSKIYYSSKPSTPLTQSQMLKSSISSELVRIHHRFTLLVEGDLGVHLGR
jgi:hypothetical protein